LALAWFISFPTTDGLLFVAVDAPMRTTEINDFRFVDGTESSCDFDSLVEEAMKLSPKEKKLTFSPKEKKTYSAWHASCKVAIHQRMSKPRAKYLAC